MEGFVKGCEVVRECAEPGSDEEAGMREEAREVVLLYQYMSFLYCFVVPF